MAALPYMPLFVADYLADTAHLSATQHGVYMLLLMNYWQRGGPLPDDNARLAKIARVGPREWAKMRGVISEFFSIADGQWLHSRVTTELARVSAKSLKSKSAAQASVERRFGKRSTPVEPTEAHTDNIVPLAKANGPADPQAIFWTNAKAFLKPHIKGDPGSLIGKWLREQGKELTTAAINAAQLERAVNPMEFIPGYFRRYSKVDHYDPERITV